MGLFLARDPGMVAPAAATFARQGHGARVPLAVSGWHGFHTGYAVSDLATFRARGEDWVAVSGTIAVDGLTGAAALDRLLDMRVPAIDDARVAGEFVLALHRAGRTLVVGDPLGIHQLFVAEGVLSTSFVAAVEALPRVRLDAQAVYEWAFDVVPLGDATVIAEVRSLAPTDAIEPTRDGAARRHLPRSLDREDGDVTAIGDRLERVVAPWTDAFGNRIRTPLSGGLDSRLLLALLRRAGVDPAIYVYGPPGSADVTIARAIGDDLGFPVEWIEKGRVAIDPDAFADAVARNYDAFDALPTFGNIFDNGGHLDARAARHADGWLATSGGAGEVLRDFFYLPDRPTRAATVAGSFFARFAPGDATARFDARAFLDTIAAKMHDALGLDPAHAARLPRWMVDQLYPRLRCRALFGREISLESRQGPWLVPFLDHRLVALSAALPHRERVAGRFEARLLAALDPALARQPSAYGHDFAGPPSLRHRAGEWLTRVRPHALRRHGYALKRRLRDEGDEHGGELSAAYMRRVIDPDLPLMRAFFHPDAINDSGLWRRIACLEYFAARLGSRLVG